MIGVIINLVAEGVSARRIERGVPGGRAAARRAEGRDPAVRIAFLRSETGQFREPGVRFGVVAKTPVGPILPLCCIVAPVEEERKPGLVPDEPVVDDSLVAPGHGFAVPGKVRFMFRQRREVDLCIAVPEAGKIFHVRRPCGTPPELSVQKNVILPERLNLPVGEMPLPLFGLHKVPAGEVAGAVVKTDPVEAARLHRPDGGLLQIHVNAEGTLRRILPLVNRTG